MATKSANATDQRAGVRPIAFLLDDNGSISDPVYLQIRPEDLTRTEPSRLAVHQTLSHSGPAGWVDNFGAGLPTLSISGHTGWRTADGTGFDGVEAFHALNTMLATDYHEFKQLAIDQGIDPAGVKLLLVDTLDEFCWSVVPTQFVLKRSKSRPLLFQYNIALQVVSTTPDHPLTIPFPGGSIANGIVSLTTALAVLNGFTPRVVSVVGGIFGVDFANSISTFVGMVNTAIGSVLTFVNNAKDLATSAANQLIGVASDLASVGLNLFRTITAITNLPANVGAEVARVGSAFNEMVCIFANSLKPRPVYQVYSGIYGASNCSSTVGGRPPSPYANLNVFDLITERSGSLSLTSAAAASISAIKNTDPVLAPMSQAEIQRNMQNITSGLSAI